MEALLLNNVIGDNFLKEKELKNGVKGVVSLLREKKTGKRYVFHEFHGSGEAYKALQGVNCPCLPHIEQVASQDETVLVLEEYIQGDTLSFLLEAGPLNEKHARQILIQICQGLKVLHGLGVVHRDVKPDNVILRGDEAVLIDFDVSRVCKAERSSDTRVMGTAGYAAPEQFGFSQTDARADVFALGVMLNEMLTRRHPSQKLADGSLRHIIEKCIEVNVDKRYASVDELLEALNAPPPRKAGRWKYWLMPSLIAVIAVGILHISMFAVKPAVESSLPQANRGLQPVVKPTFSVDSSPVSPGEPTQSAAPEPAASEQPMPEVSNQPQEVSLQCRKIPWHGDPDVYGTEFQYDLNGDGIDETYVFAVMFDFAGVPRLLQHSGDTINDEPEVLRVAGAVWKQIGENDYEPMEEFAALLTECTVAVRQIEGERGCSMERCGALFDLWPGAICATYDSVGYWYYECSAVLDGETLTSVGSTRTQWLAEPTPEPTKPSEVKHAPKQSMLRTDGNPVGAAIQLDVSCRNDMSEGLCEVYGVTAQRLDNGYIRFETDYSGPAFYLIVVFDPPNGELFRYYDYSGTSGERELLVFDIPEAQLWEAGRYTVTFNLEDNSRFLLFVSPNSLQPVWEAASSMSEGK